MGVLFKIHLFYYLIFLCFQPLPETVALVEDIVVEYVTDMVNVFIPRLGKKLLKVFGMRGLKLTFCHA